MSEGADDTRICFERIRKWPRNVALLIGAGCSKTANVPTAPEFIGLVQKQYPWRCERLDREAKGSYGRVVGMLAEDEWRELFCICERDSGVNLAHLCIAQLIKIGVVDRVLTTNFDTLLPRACALVGIHPAIFDCVAMSGLRRVVGDDGPAIYYLHGQAYGLRMLNDADDVEAHSKYVREIVQQNVDRRALIICGYSGDCDGVLDWLRDSKSLRHPVFWAPYSDEDAQRAKDRLAGKKHRFVLERQGADEFFYDLLRDLRQELPEILHDMSRYTERARSWLRLPTWYSPDSEPDEFQQPAAESVRPAPEIPLSSGPSVPGPPQGGGWKRTSGASD
jgi:hypothetical protein